MSGIPGQAGACALQNIGAYGAEIQDVVEWVEIFDVETRKVRRLSREECLFDYRTSALDCGNRISLSNSYHDRYNEFIPGQNLLQVPSVLIRVNQSTPVLPSRSSVMSLLKHDV